MAIKNSDPDQQIEQGLNDGQVREAVLIGRISYSSQTQGAQESCVPLGRRVYPWQIFLWDPPPSFVCLERNVDSASSNLSGTQPL